MFEYCVVDIQMYRSCTERDKESECRSEYGHLVFKSVMRFPVQDSRRFRKCF